MKIGHGPATVIGALRTHSNHPLNGSQGKAEAESQGTYPNRSKLTLFAREGVAISLVLFARLFCCPNFWRSGCAAEPHIRFWSAPIAGLMLFGMAQPASGDARSAGGYPRRHPPQAGVAHAVTDEVGRRVTIPPEVRRIVTLAPNLTETVYALGLEDRLAGDTDYCDTPPAAKSKPHVGNPQNPSLEAIVALHPDLVLATTSINRVETADALARLGIPVYTTDPQHSARNAGFGWRTWQMCGRERPGRDAGRATAGQARCTAGAAGGPAAGPRAVRRVGGSADHDRRRTHLSRTRCDGQGRSPWCCRSRTGRT